MSGKISAKRKRTPQDDDDEGGNRTKEVARKSRCGASYHASLLAKNQLGFALCLCGANRDVREEILDKAVFHDLPSFLEWTLTQEDCSTESKKGRGKRKGERNRKSCLSPSALLMIRRMIISEYLEIEGTNASFNEELIKRHELLHKSFEQLVFFLRTKH